MANPPQDESEQKLTELAKARWGAVLKGGDEALIKSAATGMLWAASGNEDPASSINFPKYSETEDARFQRHPWGEHRNVTAGLLAWLCADKAASALVARSGISILGARIVGDLNLNNTDIPFPLSFKSCRVQGKITLRMARIPELTLNGSWVGPIDAEYVDVKTNVLLESGFYCDGGISLTSAQIGASSHVTAGVSLTVREKQSTPKVLRSESP
jgi:hypothetical protein